MRQFVRFTSLLFLLGFVSTLFADSSVINKKTSLMLNGKKVGFVTVLTPIETLGNSKIKVKGYRYVNYPQMIVRDMKRREVYIQLKDKKTALKAFKVIKKHEDAYGEFWEEVEGIFSVEENSISKNSNKLFKKAKSTYRQACAACHHLHPTDRFRVNQWPQEIKSMLINTSFDEQTASLVTKYLQQHAVDAK